MLLVPHWSYGSDGAGDEEPQELEEYVPPVSRLFSFFRELLSLKKEDRFRIVICCWRMMIVVEEGQLSALGMVNRVDFTPGRINLNKYRRPYCEYQVWGQGPGSSCPRPPTPKFRNDWGPATSSNLQPLPANLIPAWQALQGACLFWSCKFL